MGATGQIVVLNGPSSAGKTTLAHAIRSRVGANSAAVSIDDFFGMVHPETVNNWKLFSALSEAAFAAAAALATAGFVVIVDVVFERRESYLSAERIFASHVRYYVAVTCALETLEDREASRGNRRIGQARGQYERVLQDARYALRLDTSELAVRECVDRVLALLGNS
jgi:chloramphenicol 3-O phosphotransferase